MATVEVSKECLLAMDKAKVALMMKPDSVFFITLCFSMRHVWSDQIPTAATDGVTLYWNPVFFMELTPDNRVFLMLHETLHAAYLHVGDIRKGARCPDLWNKAGDYVINLQLVDRGFVMPTGKNKGLLDYKYKDMCVEEVYNLLEADPSSKALPLMGDLLPTPEGMTDTQLADDMQDILVRAAVKSKMENDKPGTIPGDIQMFLDKLLNPKLPWNRILQKYLQAMLKNDYTWRFPNRRFFLNIICQVCGQKG